MASAEDTAATRGRSAELTARLGYLLKHAQLRFQAIQREALTPLALDGRLLAVLSVASEGPEPQLRLAERLGVDRTTMVALIDRLEQLGFVERRPDPKDRRARRVHVTPQGHAALEAGLAASERVEQEFLSALPADDQTAFRIMLQRLT